MSPTEKRVLIEALRLPRGARAALAGQLIESLDKKVEENVEAAWAVEIARRVDSLDAGKVKVVPWAQVRKNLMRMRRGPSRT